MQSLFKCRQDFAACLLGLLLLSMSSFALANNLEQGMSAYEAGDATTAAALLKSEAEQGVREAQLALGYLYYVGQGVDQNFALAARWFNSAAESGEAAAMYNLAWLYETGEGVVANSAKRASWLKQAADAGYPLAQYEWAQRLEYQAVLSEAQAWYQKAASAGLPSAQQALQRLAAGGDAKLPTPAATSPIAVATAELMTAIPTLPQQPVSVVAEQAAPASKPDVPGTANTSDAPAQNYVFVRVSIANMRVAPSTQARTASRLMRGVELITHETFGGWTRVTVVNQPQLTGWINTAVYQPPK